MLSKALIILCIVALVVYVVYTVFKLIIGIKLFNRFKGQLDDLEFGVKVVDEVIEDKDK